MKKQLDKAKEDIQALSDKLLEAQTGFNRHFFI